MTRKGMALVTTLMVVGILILMAVAVITSVNQGMSLTKSYHDEVAALYIAEAGLADVMSHLEIDTAWIDGFNRESMTHRPGDYTVYFNQSGTNFERWHSVNNLTGTVPVDGPRGPLSVPAYSAVIVVVGRAGSVQRQLEAVVYSEGVINVEYPLMTSGVIHLSGDVEVTGLKSLHGFERVAAGVHSNSGGGRPGSTIEWEKDHSWDKVLVTGKVSAVDPRPDAIDFGSDPDDYDVGAFEKDAARRMFPTVGDISHLVGLRSDKPTPTIVDGGTTELTAGEFYQGGDLEVQGDLVLDGTDLYVDGDLIVNGGISGEGAVWVSGKTEFRGDATLRSSDKAAIMSEGPVTLMGFDGNDYMEAFADRDPDVRLLWDASKQTLGEIATSLEEGDPATTMGPDGSLDLLGRKLGEHAENPPAIPGDPLVSGDYLGQLVERLEAEPESSARDFMISKLDGYRDFFSETSSAHDEWVAENFYEDPRTRRGAFDAVVDSGYSDAAGALLTQVATVNYEKLGASYFQGIIYTNGSFFAANNVTALGTILVDGKGSHTTPNPLNPSQNLRPGDLVMTRGANLTFIEDFFQEGAGAIHLRGPVRVRTWAAR